MRSNLLLVFLSFFLLVDISSQERLNAMMSGPFCSDLVKSKDGSRIAWVENTRGVRTVHHAHINSGFSEECFSSLTDNGQVIGSLQFSPDGSALFFRTGSGQNRQGEIANPTSSSDYPNRLLLRYTLGTKVLDTIGQHASYSIMPDGASLLLPKGKTLYQLDLETKKMKEVISMRGSFTDLQIHPSGSELIFTSQRGTHSFIGRYVFEADRIEWIAPSVYLDRFPQYSPDQKSIAFIRIAGTGKGYKYDLTSGHPFEILTYDLASGKETVLWSSPNDAGGFAQYYPAHPLRWSESNQVLFYSEHEGFMKIYALNPISGDAIAVIGGDCEVEHSDLSIDGNTLYFSSNCGDIDRRDIFSYDLQAHMLYQLTTSSAIETYPLGLTDGLGYLKGTYGDPTFVNVVRNEHTDDLRFPSLDQAFSKSSFLPPEQVVFKSSDGQQIHGQLFMEAGRTGKKPAVIFMHGGPIRQMLLGFHYSSYYANAYIFNQFLMRQGYVVLSVNFRAGIGYGRDFRRAEGQGPRGATEYEDILAAARFLQRNPYVDPDRIGLWGGSYGGYLTAMGLARNSDIFKAGVDLHGVHDWAWRGTDFSDGGAWGLTEELMEEALSSSPVSDVDKWTSPVLMIHGDDDRNVMFAQTIDLANKLRVRGVDHEILVLPDEVHGFYRWESWLKTYEAAFDFFERKLKN